MRGWPWGSDGFCGGRKVTDAAEDFLCPTEGRLLSLEDWRELATWPSSEMDARVVLLTSVEADANGRYAPFGLESPLAPDSAEK